MWREISKAARFARAAHKGQTRKHGTPYFEHPKAVARLIWQNGCRIPETIQAAYLHDVVEDCGVKIEKIAELFGGRVCMLVDAVTKRPGESELEFYLRIKIAGIDAMKIKIFDRAHNNSQIGLLPADHPSVSKAAVKTELLNKILK